LPVVQNVFDVVYPSLSMSPVVSAARVESEAV
jgi:hypothetical protein